LISLLIRDIDDIPSNFLSRILRSGPKFKDLSNHEFTIVEKSFIRDEVLKNNINRKFQVSSIASISHRYNIPADGLRLILKISHNSLMLYPGKSHAKKEYR
jgi:hypothetical protein